MPRLVLATSRAWWAARSSACGRGARPDRPQLVPVRDAALSALKQMIRWAMGTRFGEKLLRLASEERQLYVHDRGVKRIAAEVQARLGSRVLAGPFTGLDYPAFTSAGSALFPKLLGSYEEELQPVIESLVAHGYATVIDIGAAEGYYAVGMARRLPRATVYAFEADARGAAQLSALATANGVADRVIARGRCTLQDLAGLDLSGRPLIISDCEGAEVTLLDPHAVPALASSDILLEFHSLRGADPHALFLERFRATHDIRIIDVQPRDPDAYPALGFLSTVDREHVLYEGPRAVGWGFFSARHSPT